MKMKNKPQALDLNKAFEGGVDMSQREEETLSQIVGQTQFLPEKVIWRSSYWGTNQVGAVHYLGSFQGQPAVLKIQGVKPETSEIYIIGQFNSQNRSKIIRPPKIFYTIPWSDDAGFEAIIMEHVTGEQVLQSKKLQDKETLKKFFDLYTEYRENCLPQKPWLSKPLNPDPSGEVEKTIAASLKAYSDHPFREEGDKELALGAAQILVKIYKDIDLEFVHGHISTYDLIYQGDQVVLFSNLFWKWKFPFADSLVAYHWSIYELEHVENITPEQVDEQRALWQETLFALPTVKESRENSELLKAALLERAISGLILDSFLVNKDKPIAKYMTDSTREQVQKWMQELS